MRKNIRRLSEIDMPYLRKFWTEHWIGEEVFTHGQVVRFNEVDGFIFGN